MSEKANASATATSGGLSASGLLGVALIVLKLTGHIEISWLWATAPFWIPFGVFVLFLIGLALVFLVTHFTTR